MLRLLFSKKELVRGLFFSIQNRKDHGCTRIYTDEHRYFFTGGSIVSLEGIWDRGFIPLFHQKIRVHPWSSV